MLFDNWQAGQNGHTDEHNKIAARINYGIYVDDFTSGGIRDAIAAAQAASLSKVFLLAGVYSITDPITVPFNIELVGAGNQMTLLLAAAELDHLFLMSDPAYNGYTRVSDVALDGASLAQVGIEYQHSAWNTISNVIIRNTSGAGLLMHGGVWGCEAHRLRVTNCGHGVQLSGDASQQANHNLFSSCVLSGNAGSGFELSGGTGTKIVACDAENNALHGVHQTGGCVALSIAQSHFERNGTLAAPGSDIAIRGTGSDVSSNVLIQGCYLFGGSLGGSPGEGDRSIVLENTAAALIQANFAWGHNLAGLYLVGSNPDLLSQNNTLY